MDLERRLLRHIGFASTAVGVLLFAASPVLAADGSFFSPITKLITSPFGGHSKKVSTDDSGSTIDYRPRPMLVVPPNNNLPPPHPSIVRSKDWPKDPDANALRKARADSRQLAPAADSKLDPDSAAAFADNSPPPPSEPAAPSPPSNCTTIGGMPFCVTTPWGKITLPGGGKSASASGNGDVHLSSTPTRKYLIDPPVTYLVPVQMSESDQKEATAEKSKSKCLIPTPGWFGCPANDQ